MKNINEITSFGNRIEDNKQEKFAFVIDFSKDVYKDDFLSVTNE
jgi:hypothetical protein